MVQQNHGLEHENETLKTQMFRFVDVHPLSPRPLKSIATLTNILIKNTLIFLSIMNIGTGVGNLAPSLAAKKQLKKMLNKWLKDVYYGRLMKALPITVKKENKPPILYC